MKWNEMVKANCARASSRAVSLSAMSGALAWWSAGAPIYVAPAQAGAPVGEERGRLAPPGMPAFAGMTGQASGQSPAPPAQQHPDEEQRQHGRPYQPRRRRQRLAHLGDLGNED